MTLPDFTQLLTTVAVGAGATLFTLKISIAKIEERMAAADARQAISDKLVQDAFSSFRKEAGDLGKAVSHLAETVARQSVMVDGMENIFDRLRLVESDVAVLKSKQRV